MMNRLNAARVAVLCGAWLNVGSILANDAPQPTAQLLELKPGMQWQYRAEGSITAPNAPAPLAMSGRITITIVERELKGEPTLALEFAQALAPAGPPPAAPSGDAPPPESIFGDAPATGVFYFRQEPKTRDVYFIGDNHGAQGATRAALEQGGLFIPGEWSAKTSYANTIKWEGGGVTHNFLAVDGVEFVETGVGRLPAWRAPNGSDAGDGVQISGTDWWTPELGQPAQFEALTKLPTGVEISIRAVLERTNVAAR